VLFLLHGGTNNQNAYVSDPAFLRLSAAEPDDRQTIVVTPYGGIAGFYVDWFDHSHNWETRIIKQVVPVIDHRYRTLPDRAHRGIAGGSMGGWGAIHSAMRHPGLFSVVGSFSGTGDNQPPDIAAVLIAATQLQRHCEDHKAYGSYDPFGMFGNPVVNESSWQAQNPALHATDFRGMSIYLTAGLGMGCNSNDSPQPDPIETVTNHGTLDFHLALVNADVPHIYDAVRCGQHTAPYFARDLRIFWPLMTGWLHNGQTFTP
jgi:S-formylglutathione hydrolase FrmB